MPTAIRIRSKASPPKSALCPILLKSGFKQIKPAMRKMNGAQKVSQNKLKTGEFVPKLPSIWYPTVSHAGECRTDSAQRSCSRLRRVFMFVSEGRERKKGEESWRHSEKHQAKQSRTKGETSNTNCRSQWPHHTHLLSHPESRQLLAQASK